MTTSSGRDALTAEVLRHSLMVAAEEAGIVVIRSAYSTFIVEGSDASAAILDRHGRLIAHSVATTLMNSMALSVALPEVLADHPAESMRPGDVFALNDAYRGGIHTNDILVFRPIFVGDTVEYFSGTLIHVSDLGGASAGGMAALATDIFAEGLQLPPVRIATADGLDPVMERLLRLNSRTPDLVMGDVRALIAGAGTAARRIEELLAEYGPAEFRRSVADYLDYTEARTRRALAALRPGTYRSEYAIDDDGVHPSLHPGAPPLVVRVAVTVAGGSAVIDFEGTDAQVAAAVNSSLSQSLAGAVFAIRCFLDPTLPMNAGGLRPLDIRLPAGSLLNAQSPYPCGGRFLPVYAAIEAIMQAMSEAAPDRAIAASGILQPFSIAARQAPYWIHLAYDFGGVGARAGKDGPDATGVHFGIGRNSVPQTEPVETRCPLVVEAVEFIPDSGGPGRWRGGLGSRTTFRLLADADVTTRGDRLRTAPPGRDGGRPGRLGGFFRRTPDGTVERLPAKNNNAHFRAGEAFIVETTGGGGLGRPEERDIEAVRADVADGRVTRLGAERDFGVVIGDDE
ncbi:hydantoinase B/oxoprolinase family protein [Planotetraspora sp. A-T 1434]|uniref:hydantoinase B/oxoprolinase family protein n=1 Tax=Planotetraspora sp. A-T 1434 TaxID=2979219 RepID=UPI0021C1B5FA|nr:hydantoinase B/oxoprolinase family protein [Planotetraspora sp. A-T 1434]MCT9933123.1 hydantoinase B/oxoprolinase family protein [Planotetraspora sp. A-T 1434]